MARQLIIRGVPDQVHDKLRDQSDRRGISQQRLLLEGLEQVVASREEEAPKPPKRIEYTNPSAPFRFVDLFAGIGGMRLGLEAVGGECVFGCEWDKYARQTYQTWFPHDAEAHLARDIKDIAGSDVPDHDVLAAGFPCQPFSIAGVSKKKSLGREHGFKDETQGTMFFHLTRIIEEKRPPAILLENVKNLRSHDKGNTWRVILGTLEQDLKYWLFPDVIDACHWVPQHRERIILVGFDKEQFPEKPEFDFQNEFGQTSHQFRSILEQRVDRKYTLSDKLWTYLQDYAAHHRSKGNGFGYGLTDPKGIARTLSARYYKDGSEVLVRNGKSRNPRRLTPREAANLMGFPANLPIVVSDTQAYKQFGNAVVPHVVKHVGHRIVQTLNEHLRSTSTGCLIKGR